MSPGLPNPFSGSQPFKRRRDQSSRTGVASRPEPLVRATLSQNPLGWEIHVEPMRAFDALRVWPVLSADDESSSLLFDVVPGGKDRHGTGNPLDRWSLTAAAERLSIPAIDRFDDDYLIMDAMPLRELVGMLDPSNLRCVLVEGPIEPRDARDILRAASLGISPLQVELRAAASLEVRNDHSAVFQTRTKNQALRCVAESFRVYLSLLRSRPVGEFAAPELWQLERLLDVSGTISVRPLETDAFASFLDIGVSTATEPFTRPADRSLIYDLPSNSWHDE